MKWWYYGVGVAMKLPVFSTGGFLGVFTATVAGVGLIVAAVAVVAYQAFKPIYEIEFAPMLTDLVKPEITPDAFQNVLPASDVEASADNDTEIEVFEAPESEVFEFSPEESLNSTQSVNVQVINGEVDVDVQGGGKVTETIERTEDGTHVFVEQKIENKNSSSRVVTDVRQSSSTD